MGLLTAGTSLAFNLNNFVTPAPVITPGYMEASTPQPIYELVKTGEQAGQQ